MTDDNPIRATIRRLRWPLRLTGWGLLAERITHGFWPVWTILFAVIAAMGFGLHDPAPIELVWAVGALAALGAVIGLWRGWRRFRWPRDEESLDRLDVSLPGRPLTALADSPATGGADPAAAAVWRAHQARMAARAVGARPVAPDLRLAHRDPLALRYVALTALVLAFLFGAPARVTEVAELTTRGPDTATAAGPSWEGWVQPPSYTGKPTIYLNDLERPRLDVPEGSRVSIRLYGRTDTLTVSESVSGRDDTARASDDDATEFAFDVARSGGVSVQGPGARSWEITAIPDDPPSISTAGPIERESGGRMRLPWRALDDYGVTAAEAELTLDLDAVERRHGLRAEPEERDALRVTLPLPSGDRTEIEEVLIEDLSQHPWAGMPVRVELSAEDAPGQVGESRERETTLPGRRFFDPVADAVIEMRRDLLWTAENAPRVVRMMRAVTHRAGEDDVFDNERAYLMMRTALRELEGAMGDDGLARGDRDAIADDLWDIAILLEEGDLADARERLSRAQDRLEEAMRRGASDDEISELMDELREAMNDYMRQLAEQGGEDGTESADGDSAEISGDQLAELLDRIEELMREGRMSEAEELMRMLAEMMENMQVAEGDGQGDGAGEAMEELGQALRDQQQLSDDTFRENQDGAPGDGAEPGNGEDSLADRQRALRDELGRQRNRELPGEGTPEGDATRDSLERAEREMDGAEQALRDEDHGRALDRQAEALDALRDGMRSMDQAMRDADRDTQDGQALGEEGQRDPLGRDMGRLGRLETDDPMLDRDGGGDLRSRELRDEIRRRSGEQDRPEIELDYLRRLLDRF